MKKRIITFLLLISVVFSLVPFAVAENALVTSVSLEGNEIKLTGISKKHTSITVTLLKPGITKEQAGNAKTRTELRKCIEYTDILTVAKNGEYEYTFNPELVYGKTYTLYVTDGKSEYTKKILADIEDYRTYIDFIEYNNDFINITGHTKEREQCVAAYLKNEDKEIIEELSVISDEYGMYEFEITNIPKENERYSLFISMDEKTQEYTIKFPEKVYVNPEKTDAENSFSAIEEARDYLRKNLRDTQVEVIINGGEYNLSSAIEFTEEDKRAPDTMVTYKSVNNESVKISGKKQLDIEAFQTVTDSKILDRMYEDVRGKVVVTDLKKQGVSSQIINFTKAYDDPDVIGKTVKTPIIFLNGERQEIAKWPNSGFKNIVSVVSGGASSADTDVEDRYNGAVFKYNSNVISRWENAEDIFIEGYLKYPYISEWAKVKDISADSGRITLKYRTVNGVSAANAGGCRWRAVNLLEEIDMPGEWYIDSVNSLMYYYPPHELKKGSDILEIGEVNDDLIRCRDTKYIAFSGIEVNGNFDSTVGHGVNKDYKNGIEVLKSEHIFIKNCYVHDVVGNGIYLSDNSSNVKVSECVINNVGLNGVVLTGGDRDKLEWCRNIVEGCDISRVSLASGDNWTSGIRLNSIGAMVENNTIHSTRTNGIGYVGSENIIRNNELYFNSYETADSGAIYSGRKWTTAGNLIEKNVIHDVGPMDSIGKEVWMVYWDDVLSGNTMKNNILIGNPERKDIKGLQIAQGPNNNVYNNTFVDFAVNPIDMSYRGEDMFSTAARTLTANPTLPYSSELYMRKYPFFSELAALKIDDDDVGERNYEGYRENVEITGNVTLNSELILDDATSKLGLWWTEKRGFDGMDIQLSSNVSLYDSKYFVNPELNDYRLKTSFLNEAGITSDVNTDENFDIKEMGSKIKASESICNEFELVYPENGMGTGKITVTLKWNEVSLADTYKYQLSTDKDFNNVVFEGVTNYTNTEISGLAENTTYYWRIIAEKCSINDSFEKMCNDVYVFSTGKNPIGITYGKMTAFENYGEVLEKVTEGKKVEVYDEVISDIISEQNITYIFAAYSKNDRLVFAKYQNVEIKPSDKSQKVFEFTVPETSEEVCYYKLLRWNGIDKMMPIKQMG